MQMFGIQTVQGVKSQLQKRCDGAVFMSSVGDRHTALAPTHVACFSKTFS